MEEKENQFPDMEKLKAISAMIQPTDGKEEDFYRMIDTVKKIKMTMDILGKNQPQSSPEPHIEQEKQGKQEKNPFSMNRQEHIIHAAIPFLDHEYQKNLYMIVRLMEMQRVMQEDGMVLEARSKKIESPQLRQRKLLEAIRPYLNGTEKQNMDLMLKMIDMKTIMDRKEEE